MTFDAVSAQRTALIVGAGGVLGDALGKELSAAGYSVIGLRRSRSPSSDPSIRVVYCDLQDEFEMQKAMANIVAEHDIDVLVHNAAQLVAAPFAQLTLRDFETTWRAIVGTAILATQAVLPTMLRRGGGALVFSGATASIRASARFAAFASAKFALRGLAQSLAREYQSQGIHVAHVVLDGLLRGSPSVQRFGGDNECALDPLAVASAYRWLLAQPVSAWTHEIDLRPQSEKF